jgi:hypothetical protein
LADRCVNTIGSNLEKAAKATEKKTKEVATKADALAKRLANGAADWATDQVNKFKKELTKAKNLAVAKLREAGRALKAEATKRFNDLKKAFLDVIERTGIKDKASNAIELVVKLFNCIRSYMPSFERVELGNIYVGCMLDPKKCDPSRAKLPYFKVCMNKFCMQTPHVMTPDALLKWLKNQVFEGIKAWTKTFLTWKASPRLTIPTGINTGTKYLHLKYPNGINYHHTNWCIPYTSTCKSVHVPDGTFSYHTYHNWLSINHVPTGVATRHLTFYYPETKSKNCHRI